MDPRARLLALAGPAGVRSLVPAAPRRGAEACPGLDGEAWPGRRAWLGSAEAAARDREGYVPPAPHAPDVAGGRGRRRALVAGARALVRLLHAGVAGGTP